MKQVFLLLSLIASTSFAKYTMADLEVLEKQKAYTEFLQHAYDIRPQERNAVWQQMLSEMLVGLATQQLKQKQFQRSSMEIFITHLSKPEIKNDDFFQQALGDYALAYFKQCQQHDICLKQLLSYQSQAAAPPHIKAELGLVFMTWPNAPEEKDLWANYFAPLFKSEISAFYCQKKPFQQIALKQMQRQLIVAEAEKWKDQIFHADCWKEIEKRLHQELESQGIFRVLAFEVLQSLQLLAKEEKQFYDIVYLLNNPARGEFFNRAWNTLVKISERPLERDRLLSQLKKLDPLPGSLFESKDPFKKKTMLELFHRRIPEYLDFYAKTCLDYLSGKKSFDRGNPTPHCHGLFRSQKLGILLPEQIKAYQNIPKYK